MALFVRDEAIRDDTVKTQWTVMSTKMVYGNECSMMLATRPGGIDPAIVGTTYDQLYREQSYLVSWQLLPSQRSMQGVVDILASIGQIPKDAVTSRYFQLTYVTQALQELGR